MFPEITRDDVFRLETDRLWLRWPRSADAAAFVKLAGEPDIAAMTANIPIPYGLHDAESFILRARAENASGAGLALALALKRQPNDAIGVIGAHVAPHGRVATLGFWLGKPFWGGGLMSEAAACFVDMIFGVTTIERFLCAALPNNSVSLRVQEKLGFSLIGRKMLDAPARGGPVEVLETQLTRGAAHTLYGARRPKFTA